MFRQRVPENSGNWVCRTYHFSLILLSRALQMFFNIGSYRFCLRQVHSSSINISVPQLQTQGTNQMMSCESRKSIYKYKGQTVHLPIVSRSELWHARCELLAGITGLSSWGSCSPKFRTWRQWEASKRQFQYCALQFFKTCFLTCVA